MDFGGTTESRARGPGGLFLLTLHRPGPYYYKTRSWKSRKGNLGRDDKEAGSSAAEKHHPSGPAKLLWATNHRVEWLEWLPSSLLSLPSFTESHEKYFIFFFEMVSLHSGRQNKCIYALTPGHADGRRRQPGTRTGLVAASEIQRRSVFALGENKDSALIKQQRAG